MPPIQKILVPIDFSPGSRIALEHAIALADLFDARIHLLHAWDIPGYLRPDLTVWAGDVSSSLAEHAEKEAQEQMKRFLQESGLGTRENVSSEIVYGAPYTAILDAADKGEHDLIVMGTHGRTGLTHLLLGSVAEHVVRRSRCPVMTVRQRE